MYNYIYICGMYVEATLHDDFQKKELKLKYLNDISIYVKISLMK